ncbi:hypothetical protein GDO86_014049 [Hymenochirus boettgeri]|uniref:SOCS box domain-containing protein n=1 Tax=Hymenochirus boettgeri TaxID=247094 RepID=A0A8T2JQ75_9PIPI|nr:hypothetical protein GDO86_014049 [Hymenochirus boettgeri]
MSRTLDSTLRLKTFASRSEYNLVLSAVRKLQESGFYWSTVTALKLNWYTKNLRIQCEQRGFSLQTDPRSAQPVPHFDCVLKLLCHYMPSKDSGSVLKGPIIIFRRERVPLLLSRPLSTNVSSLQHLCRKAVNGNLEGSEDREQLPCQLKTFYKNMIPQCSQG